jgi:hypothetical protein
VKIEMIESVLALNEFMLTFSWMEITIKNSFSANSINETEVEVPILFVDGVIVR